MTDARYFLHIRDDGRRIDDPEGVMSNNIEGARAHAVVAAMELMAEGLLRGVLTPARHFELVGEDGDLLEILHFGDLLPKLT